MVQQTHGLHHLEKRKRVHLKKQKYPHPDKVKNFVDKLVYIAGFFSLVMTLPQIVKIWVEKTAVGLSIISWVSYLLVTIVWVVYGAVHREKPIIVVYGSWILMHILIIAGILLYG